MIRDDGCVDNGMSVIAIREDNELLENEITNFREKMKGLPKAALEVCFL